MVSERVARKDAAWALPLPSATASARLPKITVSHSQAAMDAAKTLGSTMATSVVSSDPSQTRNITGVRHMWRGSSLRTASGNCSIPCASRVRSPIPVAGVRRDRSWGSADRESLCRVGVVLLMRVPPRWVQERVQGSTSARS